LNDNLKNIFLAKNGTNTNVHGIKMINWITPLFSGIISKSFIGLLSIKSTKGKTKNNNANIIIKTIANMYIALLG
jgi:predicted membrane chloride channel (bestrophin family)